MGRRFLFLVVIVTLILGLNFISEAAVDSVDVGHSFSVQHKPWIKHPPEKPDFTLSIKTDKGKYKVGEPVLAKLTLENISSTEQQIDFSNIELEGERDSKSLALYSISNKITWQTVVPVKGFCGILIDLTQIYEMNNEGSYTFWSYYELSDNKGINSNDLTITIQP